MLMSICKIAIKFKEYKLVKVASRKPKKSFFNKLTL